MSFKVEDYSNERMRDIDRVAMRALTKISLIVESSAKTKARFDNGDLRDSINHKVIRRGEDSYALVGTNIAHGPFNEFGTGEFAEKGNGRKGGWFYVDAEGKGRFTRGMTPQPFIRPAFRENKERAKDIIAQEFKQEFGR